MSVATTPSKPAISSPIASLRRVAIGGLATWFAIIPKLSATLGKIPGALFYGESLPSVIALSKFYINASTRTETLNSNAVSDSPIGHFGFFRSRHQITLWKKPLEWIVEHNDITESNSFKDVHSTGIQLEKAVIK